MSAPTDNDAMDTPRAPDTEMSEVEPGLVLQRGLRFAGFQIVSITLMPSVTSPNCFLSSPILLCVNEPIP